MTILEIILSFSTVFFIIIAVNYFIKYFNKKEKYNTMFDYLNKKIDEYDKDNHELSIKTFNQASQINQLKGDLQGEKEYRYKIEKDLKQSINIIKGNNYYILNKDINKSGLKFLLYLNNVPTKINSGLVYIKIKDNKILETFVMKKITNKVKKVPITIMTNSFSSLFYSENKKKVEKSSKETQKIEKI